MLQALTITAALAAPRIELYTMGQGEHLFERFGHAALCVVEGPRARDARCYNYGTTDFGSPPTEIGWEFLRGTSRFWVSVWPRERMLAAYERADRSIFRQVLPLTAAQARAVRARLAHDALPQNRYYWYHHFDDNCSTRVRDVIDEATSGMLRTGARERLDRTYRELAREALAGVTPALLAGDLFVGRRADTAPTLYEAAFLPHVLRAHVAHRFRVDAEEVYRRRGPPFPREVASSWPYYAAVALGLGAPVMASRGRALATRRLALVPAALVLGALGSVTWLIALLTEVPELRNNEALALFWPSDFMLPLLRGPWRRHYARLRLSVALGVSLLLAVGIFRQPLFAAVLMVVVPMAGLGLERSGSARSVPRSEAARVSEP